MNIIYIILITLKIIYIYIKIYRYPIPDWMLSILSIRVASRLYEARYRDLCRQKPIASSVVLRSRVSLLTDRVFLMFPVA